MTKFQFLLLLAIFNLLLFCACVVFLLYGFENKLFGSPAGFVFIFPIIAIIGSGYLVDQKINNVD